MAEWSKVPTAGTVSICGVCCWGRQRDLPRGRPSRTQQTVRPESSEAAGAALETPPPAGRRPLRPVGTGHSSEVRAGEMVCG